MLQDREFEPVGGTKTHKVDVRLVLATNDDLEETVQRGEFRQDLYYRINVISITQPPLRERIGDIPLLVEHYLQEFNEQIGKHVKGFDEDAVQLMQRYSWPGNVRELVNVVERAVVLSKGEYISAARLPEATASRSGRRDRRREPTVGGQSEVGSRQSRTSDHHRSSGTNGWNRQETARLLGINRTTLYKKMKKYDIEYESHAEVGMHVKRSATSVCRDVHGCLLQDEPHGSSCFFMRLHGIFLGHLSIPAMCCGGPHRRSRTPVLMRAMPPDESTCRAAGRAS